MISIAIKNISKFYRFNPQLGNYKTLRERLVLNNLFSYFDTSKDDKKNFWALKNLSLQIKSGEIVGVIGSNGAGKSTLLKILSRITQPSSGEVEIRGQVSSLLEVGTGFSPELTGRENIYVNGAILGMKKMIIDKKLQDIISFSGVEKFIDIPVKQYSSGMQVRLAFSVAAHLEPDIMLIDEVLAVGDIYFQEKCLGKIKEITSKKNRTIIFVSHNLNSIRKLCNRCILLNQGAIIADGDCDEVIKQYLSSINFEKTQQCIENSQENYISINKIAINGHSYNGMVNIMPDNPFSLEICYEQKVDFNQENYVFVEVYNDYDDLLFVSYDIDSNKSYYKSRKKGRYEIKFDFSGNLFNKSVYRFRIGCGIPPKYNLNPDKHKFFQTFDNIRIGFLGDSDFADNFFKGTRGGAMLIKVPSTIKKNE